LEAAPAAPQFCKTVTGLQGLRAFWIAADQAAQLLHFGIVLVKFQQRISFLNCRSSLFPPGYLPENLVDFAARIGGESSVFRQSRPAKGC